MIISLFLKYVGVAILRSPMKFACAPCNSEYAISRPRMPCDHFRPYLKSPTDIMELRRPVAGLRHNAKRGKREKGALHKKLLSG